MSRMTVFCDNYECMFIDECGFCDCDKLSIVGGVCEGSYHGGRNATDAELDHIEDKSRWFQLFGTPEKAARTITRMQMATDLMGCCDADTCPAAFDECWKLDSCPMDDYDALLEWMRGDAE